MDGTLLPLLPCPLFLGAAIASVQGDRPAEEGAAGLAGLGVEVEAGGVGMAHFAREFHPATNSLGGF